MDRCGHGRHFLGERIAPGDQHADDTLEMRIAQAAGVVEAHRAVFVTALDQQFGSLPSFVAATPSFSERSGVNSRPLMTATRLPFGAMPP